jgi:hypothetical protein
MAQYRGGVFKGQAELQKILKSRGKSKIVLVYTLPHLLLWSKAAAAAAASVEPRHL